MPVKALALLSSFFTLLPFIVGIFRLHWFRSRPQCYLLAYFFCGSVTEAICYVLMQYKIANGMVFNLFSLVEILCFWLYYRQALDGRRHLVATLLIVFLLSWVIIYSCFDPFTAFSLKARFSAQFFLLLLSLLCLFGLLTGARASITRHYSFWVSVAIQVYVMGNLFYFLSFNLLLGTPARHLIHIALNVAYNLLLIWPLLTKKRISG